MTDGTFGMVFRDYAIVAADMCQISSFNSLILMMDDVAKMRSLSEHQLISCIGEQSDTSRFSEYVARRSHLYRLQHGYGLSTRATANFACNYLADNLRTAAAMQVNAIVAGYEDETGPELYALDSTGAMHRVDKVCAHGYGGFIILSILDKSWHPRLSQEQAYEVLKECVREVQRRLTINIPNFAVEVVDSGGIRRLPAVTVTTLAVERHENRGRPDDTL